MWAAQLTLERYANSYKIALKGSGVASELPIVAFGNGLHGKREMFKNGGLKTAICKIEKYDILLSKSIVSEVIYDKDR